MTRLQIETLRLIADGKVEQKNMGYSAWRTTGASPTVVGRLMSMKLASWPRGIGGIAFLTDAGKAALEASGGVTNG